MNKRIKNKKKQLRPSIPLGYGIVTDTNGHHFPNGELVKIVAVDGKFVRASDCDGDFALYQILNINQITMNIDGLELSNNLYGY